MSKRPIIIWLITICIMVFLMVLIGGITRLTDSGLSMVDWKPLVGAIPPITQFEWQSKFDMYKQFPEYQKINAGMTLSEFKQIFFWEYFHRLFGRLIGIVFFFPYLYFLLRKKIDSRLNKKLIVAFILGGLQGLMGWYMVKSGLVDRPDVSHFRLAAHLLLAFAIIGYIYWIILGITNNTRYKRFTSYFYGLVGFSLLLLLQITYGAFTAGLKAGLGFNTFPLMGSNLMPDAAMTIEPFIHNFINNPAMIQFVHRSLGWLVALYSVVLFIKKPFTANSVQKKSINYLLIGVVTQFTLGVATLLMMVPLVIASIHQLGACMLVLLSVNALHKFSIK